MSRPKLLIIVLFQNLGEEYPYYARSPAPPLAGALVAGLTPPIVDIELLHEMVRPINYDTDADFVALSFMDYCAPHAFEVARKFHERGKIVVAGGKYPSTFPDAVVPHFDATVVGEAEQIWPQVVEDMLNGRLKKVYRAPFAPPLDNIPPPRYDLVESVFPVVMVTETSRGCIHRCSFCQLTVENAPYRVRPVKDVIRDLTAIKTLPYHKRKLAMLLDNNFGGDIEHAKEVLREVAKLKMWAIGIQFSFDCLHDKEYVDLLVKAHCHMAFIGLESLNEPSLAAIHKRHNHVDEYQELFQMLRRRRILTFTGMMLAIDEDTPEYYENLPGNLARVSPSSILMSIAIPIPGTPLNKKVVADGRLTDTNLANYDGDHLVFKPKSVTANDVFRAYKRINRLFFSIPSIVRRWWKFITAYSGEENIALQVFNSVLISIFFFELNYFERDHANRRVYANESLSAGKSEEEPLLDKKETPLIQSSR